MDMKCLVFELMIMPATSLALLEEEQLSTIVLFVYNPMFIPPAFGNKLVAHRHCGPT
jgi:hypothetical protein